MVLMNKLRGIAGGKPPVKDKDDQAAVEAAVKGAG